MSSQSILLFCLGIMMTTKWKKSSNFSEELVLYLPVCRIIFLLSLIGVDQSKIEGMAPLFTERLPLLLG